MYSIRYTCSYYAVNEYNYTYVLNHNRSLPYFIIVVSVQFWPLIFVIIGYTILLLINIYNTRIKQCNLLYVLEWDCLDKPLAFDITLIQLSFHSSAFT